MMTRLDSITLRAKTTRVHTALFTVALGLATLVSMSGLHTILASR